MLRMRKHLSFPPQPADLVVVFIKIIKDATMLMHLPAQNKIRIACKTFMKSEMYSTDDDDVAGGDVVGDQVSGETVSWSPLEHYSRPWSQPGAACLHHLQHVSSASSTDFSVISVSAPTTSSSALTT